MTRLFGTDGVRGIANQKLTPKLCYDIGRAAAFVLTKNKRGKVLVGRDTRLSGDLVESALIAGFMSIGLDVDVAGVIPTPGVAYLTRTGDYLCGVSISASHNPFEYNGIKFFSSEGLKLDDSVEDEIEEKVLSTTKIYKDVTGDEVGIVNRSSEFTQKYIEYLKGLTNERFDGLEVAVDAGNGAQSHIAEIVLKAYGAKVKIINNEPNGMNINDNCGSTNPKLIEELVKKEKSDIGMSFDGDADRIIAVDELGNVVDGDHILAIAATYLKENNNLKNNAVVGTIMSNMGLKKYLENIGVDFIETKVGDRYILEKMLKDDYVIGAEQSGHVIFLDYNTTGDGLATGIHLLEIMKKTGKKLSELNGLMRNYPQVLKNAKVRDDLKNRYEEFPEIIQAIKAVEEDYHGSGRVVIRPSGTEALVRVMIEGEDKEKLLEDAEKLVKIIEDKLN
ncbi:MAG: phosphoglucosamine mutase [Peptoniphilus sp.]|uniref:phosphoglucosamine mutase n=1 Tax=Peptoniphilus sp. TaxID=1971214 RepID=UPI0025D32973|nr:phosphoglucosamine mutase [Peptoniphilus sp.]MCI5643188.1 phosphoglucosamine mutase [Peptoniphilus sp.]MDD7352328.1 phosphoglucosamine mutase [Peptoniphilaceae bacterium]MDY3902254.1 phosphoglucosamine mutase [Peptoniphilus sp.]